MAEVLTYEVQEGVATIALDDGKANVLGLPTQAALHEALDRAEAEGGPLVLAGRPGTFSGGFDLATFQADPADAVAMVLGGFELAVRVLSFPRPVVVACTGHAIAMGAFLVLCGDHRVGAAGPYRLVANEVAIGLTLPHAAVEVLRQRLTPAAFERAALLAEVFDPAGAVPAGFLDEVVEPDAVVARAHEVARHAAGLDLAAHAATKQRVRRPTLDALRAAIEADRADLEAQLRAASAAS